MSEKKGDRLLRWGIFGTILGCVACFTPAAVILLGFLGLARWVGYLDYVLFPMLGIFVVLLGFGLWQRRQRAAEGP